MRRFAFGSMLLVTSALAGPWGCLDDEGCSGVGCGPPLWVEVHRETWEPGAWKIELDSGDSCTWTIPDPGGYQPGRCRGSEQPSIWVGNELPDVTVSLSRDGMPIGSQTIRPEYRESGDECLTCTSAHEVVEL